MSRALAQPSPAAWAVLRWLADRTWATSAQLLDRFWVYTGQAPRTGFATLERLVALGLLQRMCSIQPAAGRPSTCMD